MTAFQKAKYREKFQLFPENTLTYTSLRERFYYLGELRSLFIGKKETKWGWGEGARESPQQQAEKEKTFEAEGFFNGKK